MNYASITQAAQIIAPARSRLLPATPPLGTVLAWLYISGQNSGDPRPLPVWPSGSVTLGRDQSLGREFLPTLVARPPTFGPPLA